MFKKVILCLGLATANVALACTAVDIQTRDGSVIAGRTMEWSYDMQWQLMSLPKGTEFNMSAPESLKLLNRLEKTKYAFVGIGPAILPGNTVLEGQNSAGLGMSGNFLPGFTQYQTVTAQDTQYVSILDFGTWALGNFATVAEIRAALPGIKVWADDTLASGPTPPTLHFVFTDKSNASIVVEYVGGQLKIYDNATHTLTNAPTYDWHLTNLRNYLNLNVDSDKSLRTGTVDLTQIGAGGGMTGMPGDYTPPSRMVRAAFLRHYATQAASAPEGMELMGHILNNVDVPIGVAMSQDHGKSIADYTQFVVIKDLTHNKMLVTDYTHRLNYVSLDLDKLFAQTVATKVQISALPYPTAPDATTSLMK